MWKKNQSDAAFEASCSKQMGLCTRNIFHQMFLHSCKGRQKNDYENITVVLNCHIGLKVGY